MIYELLKEIRFKLFFFEQTHHRSEWRASGLLLQYRRLAASSMYNERDGFDRAYTRVAQIERIGS